MNLTLIICAIVITIAFVAFVIEAIKTFARLRQSAEAIEILSLNANNRINSIDNAIETAKVLSSGISSGWLKMIAGIVGLFAVKKAAGAKNAE
ncbi:MAG: hypothetical protein KAR84_08295 [Elusimicrobiales bacterium]|nr:hypothetical protein [Elusimicrobiales bacterium]MCK5582169.1 hypothetical protein [Elusimicrobiales bacterium]